MNSELLPNKLKEFEEFLSISNTFTDIFRWIFWVIVQGLAWCVDMLENVADEILLIKDFYNHPEIIELVQAIQPFLYVLLALSLTYTGYLLIFNKKLNREAIVINIFLSCVIIVSLHSGIDQAREFTDTAIDTVIQDTHYTNEDSTLSDSILKENITDLTEIDKNGWAQTNLDQNNNTPPSRIKNINIREKYNEDTEGISSEGIEVAQHMLSLDNSGEFSTVKLDQSGLEWNNEYYFRYSVNWVTILVTLGVIAFTLFSISLKLARLFFELTFNYILALIIAPSDIHDGQKTKKIIQSILNTFIATILIFLSMKVYLIGTGYLEETLSSLPYLIALIAFSLCVIDGPNIVERLFGIDAGLKSGWGVLAGVYAGGKVLSNNTSKGMNDMKNSISTGSSFRQQDRQPGEQKNLNHSVPTANLLNNPSRMSSLNDQNASKDRNSASNLSNNEASKNESTTDPNRSIKNQGKVRGYSKAPSPNYPDHENFNDLSLQKSSMINNSSQGRISKFTPEGYANQSNNSRANNIDRSSLQKPSIHSPVYRDNKDVAPNQNDSIKINDQGIESLDELQQSKINDQKTNGNLQPHFPSNISKETKKFRPNSYTLDNPKIKIAKMKSYQSSLKDI